MDSKDDQAETGDQSESAYSYEPLEEGCIRLLRLETRDDDTVRCKMLTAKLDGEQPSYIALSYTWGDPMPPYPRRTHQRRETHIIWIDGHHKEVTTNLYDALLRLSSHYPESESAISTGTPIWIDALSINQDDTAEKATQVRKMSQIYQGASAVTAWLGPADEYTQLALETIRLLAEIPEERYSIDSLRSTEELGIETPTLRALVAFFRRSWFTRAWVIQEITLARRIALLCGEHALDSNTIIRAIAYIENANLLDEMALYASDFASEDVQREGKSIEPLGAVVRAFMVDWDDVYDTCGPVGTAGMLTWFARGSGATDARDQVYALYGVLEDVIHRTAATRHSRVPETILGRFLGRIWGRNRPRIAFPAPDPFPEVFYDDVVTATDVFTNWAKFLIRNGSIYNLFSHREDNGYRRLHSLPSWVPDLTVSMTPAPLIYSPDSTEWRPAGKNNNRRPLAPDISTIIRTPAAQFDTVTGTAMPFNAIFVSQEWAAIPEFVHNVGDSEISGTTPVDALARTLIANGGVTTSLDEPFSILFTEWMQCWELRSYEQHDRLMRALKRVHGVKHVLSAPDQEHPERVSERVQAYQARSSSVIQTRRLFLTSKNYLGIAAESVEQGDEVLILPDSRTSFVFRRADDGTYKLMGEAYVHGIMAGEAASVTGEGALRWGEIEIS